MLNVGVSSQSVNPNRVLIAKPQMMQLRNVGVRIVTARLMVDVGMLVISAILRQKDTKTKRRSIIKLGVLRHTVDEGVSRVVT